MTSLHRGLTRTGLVTALTGALLLSASTANAQNVYVDDGTGDVASFDDSTETFTPAPDQTNGDIVRTRFVHSDSRVRVRVEFADLAKEGDFRGDYLRIVTNEGVKRGVSVSGGPGHWSGDAELDRMNGDRVRCRHLNHSIDFTANVVVISVPRRCLSYPRWVRLGFGTVSADDAGSILIDDAQRTGYTSVNDDVARGDRLTKG